jgi:hypothetical protein
LFNTGGGLPLDSSQEAILPENQSILIASYPASAWTKLGETTHGAFAVLTNLEGRPVAQHRIFTERFKDMVFHHPNIRMQKQGDYWAMSSDAFAWGVTLDMDGESDVSDNCFDIIPGIPYLIPMEDQRKQPKIEFTGNQIMLRADKY